MTVRIDLSNIDEVIRSIRVAIPALFIMMNDDEKTRFREILESVCDCNELRNKGFSDWMRAIIEGSEAAKARLSISVERGCNDERCDNQADS